MKAVETAQKAVYAGLQAAGATISLEHCKGQRYGMAFPLDNLTMLESGLYSQFSGMKVSVAFSKALDNEYLVVEITLGYV